MAHVYKMGSFYLSIPLSHSLVSILYIGHCKPPLPGAAVLAQRSQWIFTSGGEALLKENSRLMVTRAAASVSICGGSRDAAAAAFVRMAQGAPHR